MLTAIRCLLELGLHAPQKKLDEIKDPKSPFGTYVPPKRYKRSSEPKPAVRPVRSEPKPMTAYKPRRQARAMSKTDIDDAGRPC